jgi:SAM-dependent methyltransferase
MKLDIGCGNRKAEGFIGVDVCGDNIDVAADVHNLPFKKNSVNEIRTVAALEHFRNPFKAVSEMYRVLRHGGVISGESAFIQPYHYESYFHATHLGVYELLRSSGFHNVFVLCFGDGFDQLCKHGYYRAAPGFIYRFISLTNRMLSNAYWFTAGLFRNITADREALIASGIRFKAVK